ncbi:nucleotidyltransferase domain-containing protein, partial [Candidatus Woesearchaeota archaeon]|nr:nucleotidyltransferase domain-containing protein [Candidatus Woesearchaeota archaeon]
MAKAKAKAEKKEQPEDEFELLARNLPPDAKKRLLDIKAKLDSFKVKLLEKFDKYVIGISLLPPSRKQESDFSQLRIPTTLGMPAPEKPILPKLPKGDKIAVAAPGVQQAAKSPEADKQAFDQETINCLILVDDSDSKKMSKLELRDKLSRIMESMATEVDKNLKPQTLLLSELWQNCYDGKYEILNLIAMSAITFDMGMLKAIKIAEVHKGMVLKKFERYIVSYVLAGSLVQGRATEKSDIDVFIVIDDTDVKRMTRFELKDKLRAIIISMGIEAGELTGIKNKLNIQIYILTDFWDSIKEANPVIFTFLRDGVPFYDRGMFMPWKQLLKIGKIKPSQEAIDLYMSTGDQMLNRVKF